MKISSLFLINCVVLSIHHIHSEYVTEPVTESTTEEPTTTPAQATTTTTVQTTTVEGTTTSTDAPTTTGTTAGTTSTEAPSPSCGAGANGLFTAYGALNGDTLLNRADDGCHHPPTHTNHFYVPFRDKCFKKFHICVNGIVCLQNPYNGFTIPNHGESLSDFTNKYCMAPFFMDLATIDTGDIWFHEYDITEDCSLLSASAVVKAQQLVATETGQPVASFVPVYVLVVTWDSVPRFDGPLDETVTFQLIFVSDATRSYSFYVYKEDAMTISTGNVFIGELVDGLAVGVFGIDVDDEFYRNADNFIAWSQGGCSGATAFSHTGDCSDNKLICRKWHSCEKQHVNDYMNNFATFPPCPCSLTQAESDPSYDYTTITSAFPGKILYLHSSFTNVTYGKTCGYRLPNFQFIQSGPDRGSYAKYNPITLPGEHQLNDNYYRQVCRDAGLYRLYFEVRPPSDECQNNQNTRPGNGAGDPHFVTLDGFNFTFNGHGEYIFLKIKDIGFTIQTRTERAVTKNGDLLPVTIFTAFVVKGTGFWMQVELNYDRTGLIILAGAAKTPNDYVDYTLEYYNKGDEFQVDIPFISLRRSGGTLHARFPETGVMMFIRDTDGLLQTLLSLELKHRTRTSGLLGNFNGDNTDDLIPRNLQTALPSTSSEETIFHNFGKTWTITEAESEFFYRPGMSYDSYSVPDFIPYFSEFTDDQITEAWGVCGLSHNEQCIFDYLVTNDSTLATNTLREFHIFADRVEIANNQIPSITAVSGANEIDGNYYVYATINEGNTLQIKGTDDGTITISHTSDIPGLQRTNNADGSVTVDFTLTNMNPVSLRFTATDDMGAISPSFDIFLVVCLGCSSHGVCDFTNFFEQPTTTDHFEVATCVCEPYWEGDNCEIDVDSCAPSPCLNLQNCTDTVADENKANPALPNYRCTNCTTGFLRLGDKCTDIDECSTSSPCTNGVCSNTFGSFECKCISGYRLDTDGVTCIDINECEESTHTCDHDCINTEGSFTCSCYTGYKRNDGNTACEADAANTEVPNRCLTAGCDAAHGCTVDDSDVAVCFCNEGYTLNNDNTCSDTNECDLGVCSQLCTNTAGSFTCSCHNGFVLDADKVTCNACTFPNYGVNCAEDITGCEFRYASYHPVRGCVCNKGWEGPNCDVDVNECLDANICEDLNAVCTNFRGSYACPCTEGFQKQADGNCADIDECMNTTAIDCEQTCTNTIGSYVCGCREGYIVDTDDVTKCTDVDECTSGTSGCEQLCYNVDGRFNCQCNAGFDVNTDRRTCRKMEDACVRFTTKNCSDICTVVDNAPVCSCNNGFTLGSDEQTCIDINECENDTLNLCSVKSSCVNIVGGHTCSCEAGFKLENDQRTCTACNGLTYGVNCVNNCDCGVGASTCDPVIGCVCKTGWTGVKCDSDRDECQSSPCTAANEICVNTPGAYVCTCKSGYEKDVTGNCVNINECNDSTLNTCSQICTDNDGSFTCSCNAGFVKDGNNCNDINECQGTHGCDHICTNIVGSYRCSCQDNFQLNDDKRTCSAINACINPNTCTGEALCAQVGGVDTCTCKNGYIFETGSTTKCIDILECSDPNLNNCNQQCTELAGSYSCSCDIDGYQLAADQQTCIECEEGKYGDDCSQTCACVTASNNTQSCNKTDGSCTCNPGWEGLNCATNVNECATLANPCPENSACVDNDGSYSCICSVGYVKAGDGTCSACDSTHFGVDCGETCPCVVSNTEDCVDVNGECGCVNGWTGTTCSENINECETVNICNDELKTCSDTDGSYQCLCISGYTLNSENLCIDIDECLLGTHTCTEVGQACENAEPGFTCVCAPGYSGTGSACTPCSTGTWGEQCSNTCSCNTTNTDRCDPAVGCVCKNGWTGADCSEDINECSLGTHNCVANAVCSNTQGGFSCTCAVGYINSNGQCLACSNNNHGPSCGLPCNCVDANAINSAQSCNHINGRCECKATWQGSRCETDVDECAANPNLCRQKQNEGCHNLNGTFECSCFVGYSRNPAGICVRTTPATTVPVPVGAVGINMFVKLNLSTDSVSAGHNLSVSQTNAEYIAEVQAALTSYFEENMDSGNFQSLSVQSVRSVDDESIGVSFKVLIDDSDPARQDFAKAAHDLLSAKITLFDQNTVVQEQIVGNSTVDPQIDSETYIKCVSYYEANGQCFKNEECLLENSLPVCRLKTTDNFSLILGLGLGIPLFFIAALAIALCCWLWVLSRRRRRRRRRREYRSEDFDRRTLDGSGFFPAVIPTKISTWGRNDPVYIPYSWDEGSTITSSSDDSSKKRRRKRRDEGFSDINTEPVEYDNDVGRNFSWDFMYNYLGPEERYEIQRPRFGRSGFNEYW